MQKYLHGHFLSEGNKSLINEVKTLFIDKTKLLNPTIREKFCRIKFNPLMPGGNKKVTHT